VKFLRGQMVATGKEIGQLVEQLSLRGYSEDDPPQVDVTLESARRLPNQSTQLRMTLADVNNRLPLLHEVIVRYLGAPRLGESPGGGGQVDGGLARIRRVLFLDKGRIMRSCWEAERPSSQLVKFRVGGDEFGIGGELWELAKISPAGASTAACSFGTHLEHPQTFPLLSHGSLDARVFGGKFIYPSKAVRVFANLDFSWTEVPRAQPESEEVILMCSKQSRLPLRPGSGEERLELSKQLEEALGGHVAAQVEFWRIKLEGIRAELRDHPLLSKLLDRAEGRDKLSDYIDCNSGVLASISPRTYLSFFLPRKVGVSGPAAGDFLRAEGREGSVAVQREDGRQIEIRYTTPIVQKVRSPEDHERGEIPVHALGAALDSDPGPCEDVLGHVLPRLALLQAISSRRPQSEDYWHQRACEFLERERLADPASDDFASRGRSLLRNAEARGHIDICHIEGFEGAIVRTCPPELVMTAVSVRDSSQRVVWLRGAWDWWSLAQRPASRAAEGLQWLVDNAGIDGVPQVLVCGEQPQLEAFAREQEVCFRRGVPSELTWTTEQRVVDGRQIREHAVEFFNPFRPEKPIRPQNGQERDSLMKLYGSEQYFLYRDVYADNNHGRWRVGQTNRGVGWQGGPEMLDREQVAACMLKLVAVAWERLSELRFEGVPGAVFDSRIGALSFPRDLRLPRSIVRALYACSGGRLARKSSNSDRLSSALVTNERPQGPVPPDGRLRTFSYIPREVAVHVVGQLGWALAGATP